MISKRFIDFLCSLAIIAGVCGLSCDLAKSPYTTDCSGYSMRNKKLRVSGTQLVNSDFKPIQLR